MLPQVILNDQFSFIKGRYIGEVIRFTEDVVDFFDKSKVEGVVLQLDFAKAFDSIEWPFLFEILKNIILVSILLLG